MKSIKLFMAMAMLAIGSTAAMAQASYTDKDGNEYQFKRHWFLDVQAGGQYTVGEASFSDLLSPNFQGAIGYQFSPVFGLRGQINGIWSKGGWNGYKATKDGTPYTASYKWKYVAPGVDFMFNLSNLFCGWNPNRVFNATAFVGGGINWAGANQDIVIQTRSDLRVKKDKHHESEQLSAGVSLARKEGSPLRQSRYRPGIQGKQGCEHHARRQCKHDFRQVQL